MFNKKKKENQKIREQYEYIKRSILESIAQDGDEKELIDVDYYDKICVLEFDENNKPKKIGMEPQRYIKKHVNNNTSNESISSHEVFKKVVSGRDEIWGSDTHGGIITDSGEFVPSYNNLTPIIKTKYSGYSCIYDDNPAYSKFNK